MGQVERAYLHLPCSLLASALIFPLALHFPPSEDFNSPELILLTKQAGAELGQAHVKLEVIVEVGVEVGVEVETSHF